MRSRWPLLLLVLAPAAHPVWAQGWDPLSLATECREETARFCSAELTETGAAGSESPAWHACLAKHSGELSPGCWDHLRSRPLVADLRTLSPRSFPGFGALGNLGLLPVTVPTLAYSGWVAPAATPATATQNRLTAQVPVYRDELNQVSLSAGASWLHFGEPAWFSSGLPVPEDLWKLDFGVSYSRDLGEQKVVGGQLNFGSASDTPFANFDVTTRGLNAYYSWAASERSRWMLTVLFSNNNPIIDYVPIPGFVYLYQVPGLVAMLGVPFSSVAWAPARPWLLTVSFFGPTINSELAYGSPRGLQLFTGYSWLQQSFLQVNRPSPKDRLYYNEMHVPLGARMPLSRALRTELAVGYSFDRSVYIGTHLGNSSDGMAPLGSSFYLSWNLRLAL